jgi:2-polyprenyl-3-methyl-5-hydroxy-6-metoxy-1,4-benzoquinol methylase
MTKQAEREYAVRVHQPHLFHKPFDDPMALREFALALELLKRALPRGGLILDLGCGPGWTSIFLSRAGFDVTGVDISAHMIEVAHSRAARTKAAVSFVVADIEELKLATRDFDGVLLFDALHHCPNYTEVLRRAWSHLRHGGHLLLMEPSWLHRYSPHARATVREFGVTELGFSRYHLSRTLRHAGFQRVRHYYDGGSAYRGLGGFLFANLRLWLGYWCSFPRTKHIILARK